MNFIDKKLAIYPLWERIFSENFKRIRGGGIPQILHCPLHICYRGIINGFTCIDNIGIDDIGIDNIGIDDIGVDDIGVDNIGIDDVGIDDIGINDIGIDDIRVYDVGVNDIRIDDIGIDDIPIDNVGIDDIRIMGFLSQRVSESRWVRV